MTHARNVYIAIALEALRVSLGWSRQDVKRFCLADVTAKAIGMDV